MPELHLTINVPETEGTDDDALEQLLSEIEALELKHAANIDVSGLKWTHPEWDWESPCPNCGSELFHCEEFDYSVYELLDEGLQFKERGDPVPEAHITGVMCQSSECNTQVYRGPASFISE